MENVDLIKITKLIEKCANTNVKELEIPNMLKVSFELASLDREEPQFLNSQVPGPAQAEMPLNEQTLIDRVLDKELDDEMQHLTDPVGWQERLLSDDQTKIIADEGDQDDDL